MNSKHQSANFITANVPQVVVSAGLGEQNYQLKNKLQWKQKI